MWVETGIEYDKYWKGNPPHMLPQDLPTWHRWHERNAEKFLSFYYDVRLTVNEIIETDYTQNMVDMWYSNVAKRIDAVGIKEKEIWVLEVTDIANLRAIGQAITYRFLWRRLIPGPKEILSGIVCQGMDNDILAVCGGYRIMPIIVRP